MADDLQPAAPSPAPGAACPWCSAHLPDAAAAACPVCGARLVEEAGVEIPGVTSVYPDLLAAASSPRRLKRTLGAIFASDDEIPPPNEAEMPALARPDAEVRLEMLRLEMEARLRDLRAEVRSLDAEQAAASRAGGALPVPAAAPPPAVPGPEPPEADDR